MKVAGTAVLNAPREQVWEALNDPAVLVRTIPGCQRLEAIGEDAYTMTVTAGVASIKGVYTGEVRLTEQAPLDTFVLKASGSGTPGTVSASVLVRLAEAGDGGEPGESQTMLTYDADAVVGGMIAGVGQRMLAGVAKKTAGEFFSAVDDVLTGRASVPVRTDPTAAAGPATAAASTGGAAAGAAGATDPGRVYEAPGAGAALSAGGSGADFARGALVGAAAALLGALVGGWLAGRRRDT
jgi:carbon monoxide dehydrogenase subunit G